MMEKPHFRERHGDAVFIAAFDDEVVPHGAARLGDIGYAALFRPLDVVSKWEKRIGTERNARNSGKIIRRFLLPIHL